MTDRIQYLKAKKRILDSFIPGGDPLLFSSTINDDELVLLLNAVSSNIPWSKPAQADALSMFLFAGVTRFDRWFAPTPFVVPLTHHDSFAKFVSAFRRAERKEPTNCRVFELHAIKNDIFRRFDMVPIEAVEASDVHGFRDLATRLSTPTSPGKKLEFENQRAELFAILDGLGSRTLRTQLRFRVPYVLHKQRLQVDFIWRGITMQAQIEPKFDSSQDTFVRAGDGVALSVGASRWQAGTSAINLELSALLDGSVYTERLQAIPGADFTVIGWPQSFTWAFSIFHDLASTLRADHGARQDWIPAPRDLSDLEQVIKTVGDREVGWIRKGSPAALQEMFLPSSEPVVISLGALKRLSWSTECRTRANMYLELGDSNEALFWTNVATESLIAKRFYEIEGETKRTGLAGSLGSPKEFWAESELILSKQFPEMQGKVKWPSSAIHVSVYGKLKALYRLVPMKTSLDELLSNYRVISGQRNDLFHGTSSARVSVGSVQAASEALTWIDQNMWPLPCVKSGSNSN